VEGQQFKLTGAEANSLGPGEYADRRANEVDDAGGEMGGRIPRPRDFDPFNGKQK
jgi:hypothetical protein